MNKWICPLSAIDSDIRELVQIAYENNMYPYMSCSGSLKDHDGKSAISVAGTIELLDSEYIREIVAMLLDNRNFTCSISKEKEREFYDNILPEGLRFKIEFENVRGTIQEELISLFNDIISGKKSIPAQRKNVDVICELVSQFNVKDGSEINFSFNDPNIDTTRINDNNYSIQVTGRKVFEGFTNQFSNTINDIEQDKTSCTVYTSDLATAAAILKKAITDYPLLPPLKKGENNKTIKSQHREYRHLKSYNNNLEEARKKMLNEPSVIFETHHATVDDLLDFFNL